MSAPISGTRVLVVDDGAAIRALLCSLLHNSGFKVVGDLAQGGATLGLIGRTKAQIVCLDYNLPDIDGLSLLRQIHEAYPSVAVVMITGSDDPKLQGQATEAGAAGFLLKPFTQDQIVQELKHVAHAQRLMDGMLVTQASNSPAVGKRVVIAEDSDTLRRLLSMILTESGMQVVGEARNGAEAVAQVQQHKPDLVCLDVTMPVMGGLEALAEINRVRPGTPVMIITGRADKKTVNEAAQHGAKGYILKPYQPELVVDVMDKLFVRLQAAAKRDV